MTCRTCGLCYRSNSQWRQLLPDKLKFGFYWAASCGGCEIAVLDTNEKILDIVEELDEGRGVTEEEILRRMTQDGVPEEKVRHDIERLHNEGRLFNPTSGRYKVARERR